MAREPVGPKLRFEVLKRDLFRCRYCGARAPKAELHIDHLVPVVDEGDNDITNLMAACVPCNFGKGSNPLSEAMVTWFTKENQETEDEKMIDFVASVLHRRGVITKAARHVVYSYFTHGRVGLREMLWFAERDETASEFIRDMNKFVSGNSTDEVDPAWSFGALEDVQ